MPLTTNKHYVTTFNRPLNAREESFVAQYVICSAGKEAALKAGYASNPSSQSTRLLKRSVIKLAIRKSREGLSLSNKIDQAKVMTMLLKSYSVASNQGDVRSMIKSVENISRLCGFID